MITDGVISNAHVTSTVNAKYGKMQEVPAIFINHIVPHTASAQNFSGNCLSRILKRSKFTYLYVRVVSVNFYTSWNMQIYVMRYAVTRIHINIEGNRA